TLTILFPIYASHKALSSPPPQTPQQTRALYAPWLTYFLVQSSFSLVESYTPIIPSLPLYSFARLGLHIYLLLPGPGQGAAYLYNTYMAPVLRQHEKKIEDAIKDAHDTVKSIPGVEFALQHAGELWAMIQQRVFGKDVRKQRNLEEEVRHAPPSANTYVASLLGRFIAPEAEGAGATAAGASSMAGLLNTALSQASNLATAGGSRSVSGPAGSGSRGEPLIPEHLSSDRERLGYITGQRDRLRTLLSAYDKEEETIHLAASGSKGKSEHTVSRNRSEHEFETIGQEDVSEDGRSAGDERRQSKGWSGWMFGGNQEAKSSGVDTGR
ncbi:MAG: hypothetical protein Q9162_003179, partial [Coniocarpon cinnabarinum]